MKNISTGNWITIIILFINIVFTMGFMFREVLSAQESANLALEMAYDNDKEIAVMEERITQGFENLESLIRNGH